MHSVTTRKAALAALLVLAALLSIFAVGKRASDPAYHQASIDALAEKQETVLELTAAATPPSAAWRARFQGPGAAGAPARRVRGHHAPAGRRRDAHRRKAR